MQQRIVSGLAETFCSLGLNQASDCVFLSHTGDLVRMVQISFLSTHFAAYFGTTTASFSLEFGGLYQPVEMFRDQKGVPAVPHCQVRGCLTRDYAQPAPKKALPAVEHKRRDIWWVAADGQNVDMVIESAVRVAKKDLPPRLQQLADYPYLARYLLWRAEKTPAFYGFGARRSPARRELLRLMSERLPPRSMLAWLARRFSRPAHDAGG